MSDDEEEYSDNESEQEIYKEELPKILTKDEEEVDDAEKSDDDDDDDSIDDITNNVKFDYQEDDDDDENIIESDDDSDLEEGEEREEEDENIIKSKNKKSLVTKKTKKELIILDEEDEDDQEEEFNENYLEKFDSELVKNYIADFHPECFNHNYDEISKMSNVIRNSDGIIIDPLHKTIPYLTKYEKTRILGQRAKQIETGCKPFVKVPENIIESHIIAELELKEKKIPFIIKRPIPGGGFEYWKLNDLEVISF
jgi:DNA-directed RNA polymerase I, II, and III subunit RPABC2